MPRIHGVDRRSQQLARLWALALGALAVVALASSTGRLESPESATEALASSGTAHGPVAKVVTAPLKGTGLKRWGAPYTSAGGYDRYSYVLVPRHDARSAARLPGVSLVYMSGTTIQSTWSTGVSHSEALANDWLLKATDGSDLMNVAYDGEIGDIGSRAYQQRFVENVAAFMRATKVDGVFIDDVVAHPGVLTEGAFPTKYPTPEAWEDAMVSFVRTVGQALRARGYYVLVSALKFVPGDLRSNTAEPTAEFWRQLAPSVSGLASEYWLQDPTDVSRLRASGSRWYENWTSWQRLVAVAQDLGRDFFALSYGSSRNKRAMRYLRSSFLLDWNGVGGALIYSTTDTTDPFHPIWVKQLGPPVARKFQRSPGVWQRRFARGIVVVNTTTSAAELHIAGSRFTIGPIDALMVAVRK